MIRIMTRRHKVMVVEDDPVIRDSIAQILASEYETLLAADGVECLVQAELDPPSLILLDTLMPRLDGIKTCEALRSSPKTHSIPVIVLSALTKTDARVKAFKAGADDYISKPFDPEELLTRIRAKIERMVERPGEHADEARSTRLVCGNIELDRDSMSVLVAGREVTLTQLEFNLLAYLMRNQGKLRTRAQITEAVWAQENVPARALDPHIVALRKKLWGADHAIHTVYREGYILKPARRPYSASPPEAALSPSGG